jgi:hypothetical protein
LVAALLEHDANARKSIRTRGRKVASALTIAETGRAILRARVAERLTADQERAATRALRRFERRCYLVAVTNDVLARAAAVSQSNRSVLLLQYTLQRSSRSMNSPRWRRW